MSASQSAQQRWSPTWQKLVASQVPDLNAAVTAKDRSCQSYQLEQLLEHCIKVFLTTRNELLESDIQAALAQICHHLGARLGVIFACPDRTMVEPNCILSSLDANENHNERISAIYQQKKLWCRAAASHQLINLCSTAGNNHLAKESDNTSDAALINATERDVMLASLNCHCALLIPIIGREQAGGCLLLGFDHDCNTLSDSITSLLSTFAQLCFLVIDRALMVDRLQAREQLLARTERLAKIGSWFDEYSKDYVAISQQTAEILEFEPGQQTTTLEYYISLIHPEDRPWVTKTLAEAAQNGEPTEMVYRVITRSGREKHIHGYGDVVRDGKGEIIGRGGSVQDVTAQQLNERHLHQAAVVFESTMEGIVITDSSACIEAVNPAFSDITGYSEEDIVGRPISVLKSGRYSRDFYATMYQAIDSVGYWRGEIWNRKKNGEVFPEWLTITAVRDHNQRITHYVGVFSDMSKIKESERRLEHLSYYDSLTNLPNRSQLLVSLQDSLERAERHQRKVGIMAIDLDHFKNINDSLGHPVGDRLLQEFAARLRNRLRESDTVARLGGDDFMVVLEDIAENPQVEHVAGIIHALLREPFDVGVGQDLFVNVSMGICVYPDHGSSVTQLISNADVAMFQAKSRGRNHYLFYNDEMTQAAADRLELSNQLRKALQHDNELQLYYQPQVCIETNALIGVEALMRWHHPSEGIIAPGRFIPVAEDSGLMPELDAWAIRVACQQIARWQRQGLSRFSVAVNITQPTFVAGGLVEKLQRLIHSLQLDPSWLELEITEGALLEPSPQVMDTIAGLKDLGVALAIDDFGTGYSSLAYLHRYQVDKLKIDRSFVSSIEDESEGHMEGKVITKTIINMARGLGLQVLAEGVENQLQLDFLRESGCESYQGFYFSRPLPLPELAPFFTKAG